jgi:hypothetical protein
MWKLNLLTLEKIREHTNLALRRACLANRLDIARWLWDRGLTIGDARAGRNEAFRCSCARGLLGPAKWLWNLGLTRKDICDDNNYAVIAASKNGHSAVVEFLNELLKAIG